MISKTLKDEIVDKITSSVTPLKIYLFGSYAYSGNDPGSDKNMVEVS